MTPTAFIAKWQTNTRNERAAAQEHFLDLCALLDEPTPNSDPTGAAYAFEKGATKASGGEGWADVWRRGRFAWEYKGKLKDLDAAHRQLLQYAGALENPPLLVTSDIERIVIRTNWTNEVSERHEVHLKELTDPARLAVLKSVFSEPERLRPGKTRAALTAEAASEFAELAGRLRDRGNHPQEVAHFINRLVFCLFADDVGLLPAGLFMRFLEAARKAPARFQSFASRLFAAMADKGGEIDFTPVAWFNGGLFDDSAALPLEGDDIALLQRAASLDWAEIDPSILGTLFERGLDPDKRSQLGAHYTSRDMIERLIDPVVRQPLLAEWRDVEISLPRELGQAEAVALAYEYVAEQFVSRGMVADLNVHWGVGADGEAQPHAHVMLTMRRVEGDGFGPKARDWNDRALLRDWRERWAEMANARLHELGHDVRIDHRSYAEQDIPLEPQHKIGPAGARRAERGEDAERRAEHDGIARRNGEQIAADPAVALDALTRQHSTFTRQDLARFVSRHTDGAEQFGTVMAKVEAAPELVRLGVDGRGRERFSTWEMVAAEQRMEGAALGLAGDRRHGVPALDVLGALDAARQRGMRLGAEQLGAVRHVTQEGGLALVVGYAGTGKSAMLGVAREAWEAAGYRVRGAALSGIAAEGLEGGSGIESRTLASLEWGWKEGRDALTARDVLVVDEAGMVGSRQMERVLTAAREAGAKVVLVGDPEQLQAIEAGAAFRALAERFGAAEIGAVRRQREAWQREATRELATARTGAALGRYEAAGMVRGHATQDEARAALVDGWAAERQAAPERSRVMLAYTRVDVAELNRLAREQVRAGGGLGVEHQVETERGARAMAAGDRLMFLRNERGLGAGPGGRGGVAVKNGTLGTVLAVEAGGERLTVRLDGPGGPGGGAGRSGAGQAGGRDARPVVTFYVRDYGHVDHGYAATVHKAQGVTVDRAHVLASAHMDRHAAYVALTRHQEGVALHWSAEELGDRAGLGRALGRERAKDTSLDYGGPERAYAERRGLDPLRPESAIVVMRPGPEAAQRPKQAPPTPRPTAQRTASAAAGPAPGAGLVQDVAQGRARFRERFEAHRRQQAQRAADEAAARELVGRWDRLLTDFNAALPRLDTNPATFGPAREALLRFGQEVREQPGVAEVLRQQGEAFGMGERPNLGRVLADPQPERVIGGIMEAAEAGTRARLQKQVAQEVARQQELAARPGASERSGPSMRM